MIIYPKIDPVALQLGPLSVHWYGLMYLLGFMLCWGFLVRRLKLNAPNTPQGLTTTELSDIFFYAALGIIIGGRLGYMVFYDSQTLIMQPLSLFEIWKGGMSFHGGVIGVIVAIVSYAIKTKRSFIAIMDFIIPVIPLGLAAGRIGNFINGELWGRVSDVPWAMVFPNAGDLPRHPSQLYEFFFEGIVLFIILWFFSRKSRPRWAISGLFLFCYGIGRFWIEFYREPDVQIGFVAFGWLTKGQMLCLPMILVGIALVCWAYLNKKMGKTVCSNI